MQDAAKKIAKVSLECKMQLDEEKYVSSFRSEMMDTVYAWSQGATFQEICKMNDIFEGSIIRIIRRLYELLQELVKAAKSIGNTDLEEKFTECIFDSSRLYQNSKRYCLCSQFIFINPFSFS